MKALLLVAWLVLMPQLLEAIEILGLFQSVGRSQWVLAEAYLRALESRGHAIIAVTTFPSSQGNSNTWTEVLIPNAFTARGDIHFFELRTRSKWELRIESRELGEALCESFLVDEGVQRLYRSGQKFDLVVLELLMTECLLGFAHLFGAPVVALSSFIGTDFIGHMVGNPWPYALVPSTLVTYGCCMSFLQRLDNAIQSTAVNLLRSLDYMPRVEAIFRRHVSDSSLPSLAELERRTALLLVNYHFSHGCPRPLVPAMVEVGGLHIREPQKLPQVVYVMTPFIKRE